MGTLSVDLVALRMAAQRLDLAADILAGALGTHLQDVRSGGASMGRLISDIGQWSRAAREGAAVLRRGADGLGDAESAAVAALR